MEKVFNIKTKATIHLVFYYIWQIYNSLIYTICVRSGFSFLFVYCLLSSSTLFRSSMCVLFVFLSLVLKTQHSENESDWMKNEIRRKKWTEQNKCLCCQKISLIFGKVFTFSSSSKFYYSFCMFVNTEMWAYI